MAGEETQREHIDQSNGNEQIGDLNSRPLDGPLPSPPIQVPPPPPPLTPPPPPPPLPPVASQPAASAPSPKRRFVPVRKIVAVLFLVLVACFSKTWKPALKILFRDLPIWGEKRENVSDHNAPAYEKLYVRNARGLIAEYMESTHSSIAEADVSKLLPGSLDYKVALEDFKTLYERRLEKNKEIQKRLLRLIIPDSYSEIHSELINRLREINIHDMRAQKAYDERKWLDLKLEYDQSRELIHNLQAFMRNNYSD